MITPVTQLPYALLAAFTGPGCAGNQALVALHHQPLSSAAMQSTAKRLLDRHPATACAFVSPMPLASAPDHYQLRSFHAGGEIQLCGHALICAAHWLWQHAPADGESLRFNLPACQYQVSAQRDGDELYIDLPATTCRSGAPPTGLADLLGSDIVAVGYSQQLPGILLVEIAEEAALRRLNPGAEAILAVTRDCLLLTSASQRPAIDIVSRYFTPAFGALEDPATGSAHTLLAPWWQRRLGERPLHCLQASAAGGRLRIQQQQNRVRIWAKCTTILVSAIPS